jgi:hypothetical protein
VTTGFKTRPINHADREPFQEEAHDGSKVRFGRMFRLRQWSTTKEPMALDHREQQQRREPGGRSARQPERGGAAAANQGAQHAAPLGREQNPDERALVFRRRGRLGEGDEVAARVLDREFAHAVEGGAFGHDLLDVFHCR